jgi:GNAT superfamily N-acetyltransferase
MPRHVRCHKCSVSSQSLGSLNPQKTTNRFIEKLRRDCPVDAFDCGYEELNRFLQRYAWPDQQAGTSQTYIGFVNETVVGYYSLAFGQVEHKNAAERISKGLAKYPIPIMLLARLAVDHKWQRQGVGSGLLKDAMLRTLQAADIAGIRALVVHAKNDVARWFYQKFNFSPSQSDPLHLMVILKDVRQQVQYTPQSPPSSPRSL